MFQNSEETLGNDDGLQRVNLLNPERMGSDWDFSELRIVILAQSVDLSDIFGEMI